MYNLDDADTVIRGTLRYEGFAFVMQSLKNLGLFINEKHDNLAKTWREYFTIKLKDKKVVQELLSIRAKYFSLSSSQFFMLKGEAKAEKEFYINLVLLAMEPFDLKTISKTKGAINKLFVSTMNAFSFLDFYNEENKLSNPSNMFISIASLLQTKLRMEEDDQDLVYMHNEFILKTIEGKIQKKTYDLLLQGRHNNFKYSATSITVAFPTACAAQVFY